MKKRNGWFFVSIVLFLAVLGLSGYIVYDKTLSVDNNDKTDAKEEIKEEEVVKTEEVKIGYFGNQQTSVTRNSMIDAIIKEDGSIYGWQYSPDANGTIQQTKLSFNGIEGKAIRIVKSYSCSEQIFELGVLTEEGDLYMAYVSLWYGISTIDFTKVETSEKVYGIDTVDFEGDTTCSHSLIITYNKDGKKYVVQNKISSEDEFMIEKDENGNIIYENNTLYEDYNNSLKN